MGEVENDRNRQRPITEVLIMLNALHRLTLVAAMLALVIGAAGCGQNTVTDPADDRTQSDAPALPSVTKTMKVDLDFFGIAEPSLDAQSIETGKPSGNLEQYATSANRSNFINAYVRAIYATLITYDALEEPIAAFALAIHSVPQPQDNGSYLWTYIFVDEDAEYSIFLYGTPMPGDGASWRLEVSTNDPKQPLDHFVWFDGETGDVSGFWQFYEPIDQSTGVPVVRVDFLDGVVEHRLTLTVNGVGHEDEGDVLDFHETEFTGSIRYTDASAGENSLIEWRADGTGFIQATDYNSGEKSCWDDTQRDTVCK
jgi:hypothetical protein